MSLAKLIKEMSDLTWDDASFYSFTYWAKTEPEIKSIDSKISCVAEIIIETNSKEEIKPYSDMSVKDRWKNPSSVIHAYRIHFSKYFNGDTSMLRLLKNDISSIIMAKSIDNNEDKELFSYKARAGASFGSAGMIGVGLSFLLIPSKDGSYSLQSEYLPYFVAASAVLVGSMLSYAIYNAIRHGLKASIIDNRKFLICLASEIIGDMPDEYLSKALDIAKDKLSLPSEIKKA